MPTLDDTPILQRLVGTDLLAAEITTAGTLSRADLIPVFDVGTQTVKAITVKELGEALAVVFA